jgi:hypothetical protein
MGTWRFGLSVSVAALMLGAACSSSSHSNSQAVGVRSTTVPTTVATTSTTSGAIGLRRNADEQAELVPDKPLTPAERQELANELVLARATALKYPTVADATAAGFILAGKFTPGAGAHYVSISGSAASYLNHTATIDPVHPLAVIYAGTAPTSRVVGLMYGSFNMDPPPGFAGGSASGLRRSERSLAPASESLHHLRQGIDRHPLPARLRRAEVGLRQAPRAVHAGDPLDGARVGGARLGQPGRRFQPREHRSALRRRHRPHRQDRILYGRERLRRSAPARWVVFSARDMDILENSEVSRRHRRIHGS